MSLIKCPDCENEISSTARFCVTCGYQKQQSIFSQDLGFDGKLFTTILIFGIICFTVGVLVIGSFGSVSTSLILMAFGAVVVFISTLFRLIRSLK